MSYLINPYMFNVTPTDPNFGSVVLLAGFNGANNDTTYTAETGQVLTIPGSSKLSSTQTKFGTTAFSCVNTSSGTFPTSVNWNLSAANSDQFTIEWWQYLPSLATTVDTLYTGFYSETRGFLCRCGDTTTMAFHFYTSTGSLISITQAAAGFTINQWDAVCIEKNSSGKIRFYLNGAMIKSNTPADSTIKALSTGTLHVGPDSTGNTTYIDELRITKGVARYDSDGGYTVSTSQFPRS